MTSTTENDSFRCRAWCFTSFDTCPEEMTRLLDISATYIIVGEEVCGTTQRPHYQGYVEFKNTRTFKSVKKSLGVHCHLEHRKGTAAQAADYCKKDGKYHERGVISQPQGARNDILAVKEHIAAGKSFEELIDVATSYQSLKIAQAILPYKEPKRNWKPVVRWYHGVAGAGKTHTAFANHPEDRIHKQSGTDKWWPGYDGHPVVIIDDFRPEFCSFVRLLDLLDKYPTVVEYKGGSRQFVPKFIYVTAPDPPTLYYLNHAESYAQLDRRIDEVVYFGEKYVATVQTADGVPQEHSHDTSEASVDSQDGSFECSEEVCETGDESSEA